MLLITGTPGWLGNRVVEILFGGLKDIPESSFYPEFKKIRCLCLPENDTSFYEPFMQDIEVIKGDIVYKETLKEFFEGAESSTLYHLAGVIHPKRSIKEFYDVNVKGTRNVLDMARNYGVKKVLVMSSNSQSGCNPDNRHLFTEESPYNPYMNYGRSKMIMEEIAQKYVNLYDMDITIIRTCWFYGPHQPERQTEFFTMIKEGKFPIIGDGTNLRSMSYVDNTCQGMLLATRNEAKGKKYWLADERPYSTNEIIDTVEDVLEKDFGFTVKHKRLRLPSITGSVAYIFDWLLQVAGFYNKKVHVLSELNKNIACSVGSAKKELGYNPEISLREGMRRSIDWCLKKNLKI
jgi:nucleoside-diphosphate-sugar epimerase